MGKPSLVQALVSPAVTVQGLAQEEAWPGAWGL